MSDGESDCEGSTFLSKTDVLKLRLSQIFLKYVATNSIIADILSFLREFGIDLPKTKTGLIKKISCSRKKGYDSCEFHVLKKFRCRAFICDAPANALELEKNGIGMVLQFPLDPMHLVDLGVVRSTLGHVIKKIDSIPTNTDQY